MDECDQNLFLTMGVGTVISIGAFMNAVREMRAEMLLVFLIAVMLLNEGVCVETSVAFWTFFVLFNEVAHLSMIEVPIPFPILGIVVIDTMFMVV